MPQTLLLQCPNCKHRMKYLPIKEGTLFGKKKKCVYCGKNFNVREHIVQQ